MLYIHTFTAIEKEIFLNQETKPPKTKTTKEANISSCYFIHSFLEYILCLVQSYFYWYCSFLVFVIIPFNWTGVQYLTEVSKMCNKYQADGSIYNKPATQILSKGRFKKKEKLMEFSIKQAGIFPMNPRTLFLGNSQSHRKS